MTLAFDPSISPSSVLPQPQFIQCAATQSHHPIFPSYHLVFVFRPLFIQLFCSHSLVWFRGYIMTSTSEQRVHSRRTAPAVNCICDCFVADLIFCSNTIFCMLHLIPSSLIGALNLLAGIEQKLFCECLAVACLWLVSTGPLLRDRYVFCFIRCLFFFFFFFPLALRVRWAVALCRRLFTLQVSFLFFNLLLSSLSHFV